MNDLSAIGPLARDLQSDAEPCLDFRAMLGEDGAWKISILSSKARTWVRENRQAASLPRHGNSIRTDICGLNFVLREARTKGLKTQYVGPLQIVVF